MTRCPSRQRASSTITTIRAERTIIFSEGAMPDAAINALKRATEGLTYMSETDEPFHPVSWDDGSGPLTEEKLLTLSKQKPGSKVEEMPIDEFFGDLTEEQDWHEDAEKKAVQK